MPEPEPEPVGFGVAERDAFDPADGGAEPVRTAKPVAAAISAAITELIGGFSG